MPAPDLPTQYPKAPPELKARIANRMRDAYFDDPDHDPDFVFARLTEVAFDAIFEFWQDMKRLVDDMYDQLEALGVEADGFDA